MSNLIDAAATGGTSATCAVCGDPTTLRLVAGDGHVPMCSRFCEHAWPNVSRLHAERDRLRAALEKIAESMCETPVGFQAEYALMTDEQRAAIDEARRGTSAKTGGSDG